MSSKSTRTALCAAVTLLWVTCAWGGRNPGNDSGAFTVRVTPRVGLGAAVTGTGI